MLAADKHAALLNDLIRINNDRIAGYDSALAQLPVGEKVVHELFENLREESVRFREELIFRVATLDEKVAADSTFSGKIFRTWMELKSALKGTDTQAIVESCAVGESAWQKAYQTVLEEGTGLSPESRLVIEEQYRTGRNSALMLEKCRKLLALP